MLAFTINGGLPRGSGVAIPRHRNELDVHIAIVTIGSRGDVQPYVALACGLRAAGHRVTLATHRTFQSLAESHGIDLMPVAGDPALMREEAAAQKFVMENRAGFRGTGQLWNVIRPYLQTAIADALQACRGADVILGLSVVEKLRQPLIRAFYFPLTPTSSYPLIPRTAAVEFPGWYNKFSHLLARQVLWLFLRSDVNAAKAGVPSLIVPFIPDQRFWGQRLHLLGVGPRPIPHTELSVDRVAAAIDLAVENLPLRRRAASLAERIRAEDGVGRAIDIVHAFLNVAPA